MMFRKGAWVVIAMCLIAAAILWFFHQGQREALGRAVTLAERSAPSEAMKLGSEELSLFESDVDRLSEQGVRRVVMVLDVPAGDMRLSQTRLPGYPAPEQSEAWEAPMVILADRMMELDPEETFRDAFWRRTWPDRFSLTSIELRSKHSPDFVWGELQRLYGVAWERYDPSAIEGSLNWVGPIFRVWEQLEAKPGRGFLMSEGYRQKPYAAWLQEKAQMGMLAYAEESGEIEDFLEWKLNEGDELVDEWTSHSFRVNPPLNSGVMGLALALLAKENPEKAIRWSSNHTLKLKFDWRAAIVSGWVEFFPQDRESVPKFMTKWQDSLNWLLERVAVGDVGLENAFSRWSRDQPLEARRWLEEKAVGPAEEEVKAGLRVQD